MSTSELIESEANRLMQHTIDALPSMALPPAEFRHYHLAGIDRDVTDELLRRDGFLPPIRDEEGRDR